MTVQRLNHVAYRCRDAQETTEFYADVLHQRPESAWKNLDGRFDRMQVDTDDAARERFALWQQGRTGFPLSLIHI